MGWVDEVSARWGDAGERIGVVKGLTELARFGLAPPGFPPAIGVPLAVTPRRVTESTQIISSNFSPSRAIQCAHNGMTRSAKYRASWRCG